MRNAPVLFSGFPARLCILTSIIPSGIYIEVYIPPFLFVVFCLFVCLLRSSRWSFVDPLIFSCPPDHVTHWQQQRILLGMVEARSVSVKNYHTLTRIANRSDDEESSIVYLIVFILLIHSSRTSWSVVVISFIMYTRLVDAPAGGSHKRKFTQDFSTFLLRCLP